MKLNEIFDPEYYDVLQDQMQRRKFDRDEDIPNDSETSMQDFIISKFEVDEISFEEAAKQIKALAKSAIEKEFWMMELISAQALKEDDE